MEVHAFYHSTIHVIPTAVAPLRYAQARPARAEPSVPSAALPPLPLRGVAAVRLSEGEQEASRSRGTCEKRIQPNNVIPSSQIPALRCALRPAQTAYAEARVSDGNPRIARPQSAFSGRYFAPLRSG